jgi:hypothetical protein
MYHESVWGFNADPAVSFPLLPLGHVGVTVKCSKYPFQEENRTLQQRENNRLIDRKDDQGSDCTAQLVIPARIDTARQEPFRQLSSQGGSSGTPLPSLSAQSSSSNAAGVPLFLEHQFCNFWGQRT